MVVRCLLEVWQDYGFNNMDPLMVSLPNAHYSRDDLVMKTIQSYVYDICYVYVFQ